MSDKPVLRVDWCSHEAAKFAVEHWHYSRTMPIGKLVKVGAWEGGEFIGCVVFGRGANNHIGSPYGLSQTAVCELVRVALKEHSAPVSRICALAIRFIRAQSEGLRLIVSYADPLQGHHGGIYQAMGWVYVGASQPQREVMRAGVVMHKRSANALYGSIVGMQKSDILWKHKYLYPLDSAMREQIAPLAKPYPKRDTCAASKAGVAPGFQPGEGGSTPTAALSGVTDDGAG